MECSGSVVNRIPWLMLRTIFLLLLVSASPSVVSQGKALAPASPLAERRTAAAFAAARVAGPLTLRAFLEQMPKGGDLHMHLSGAVYAETLLSEAAEDQVCIDPLKLVFTKSTSAASTPSQRPACPDGAIPATDVLRDQKLYDALVDAFSMRSFVPSAGISGHDWFFATFGRFDLPGKHTGQWLDEVATRAALQNEQYLEIMMSPISAPAIQAANQFGWPGGNAYASNAGTTPVELASLRDRLLATPAFRDTVATDRAEVTAALAARQRLEHCGTPSAMPACSILIRFLGQVARAFPPQRVFAQTLLYFELASSDPDVVGINFVQPEDSYMAMSEYHRQMMMLDYLHSVYPRVHISLHAGELAEGLVPPAGLQFHIREAVELGHAERIGHGVDVMQETAPRLLLKEMADRQIMVEINLTSNDVILGIKPPYHPLPQYLAAHVPVALSTDDEGVSRIDLTHEYTRAVLDFGLSYADLKRLARTSLEHSFLPGTSLWDSPDDFTRASTACSRQPLGAEVPTASCAALLKASDRAAQQWELERRFNLFEVRFR